MLRSVCSEISSNETTRTSSQVWLTWDHSWMSPSPAMPVIDPLSMEDNQSTTAKWPQLGSQCISPSFVDESSTIRCLFVGNDRLKPSDNNNTQTVPLFYQVDVFVLFYVCTDAMLLYLNNKAPSSHRMLPRHLYVWLLCWCTSLSHSSLSNVPTRT